VVITGEYDIPYCLPFSVTDVRPPRGINQTKISAYSYNLSGAHSFLWDTFFQSVSTEILYFVQGSVLQQFLG